MMRERIINKAKVVIANNMVMGISVKGRMQCIKDLGIVWVHKEEVKNN